MTNGLLVVVVIQLSVIIGILYAIWEAVAIP